MRSMTIGERFKMQARFKPLMKDHVTIFDCTHDGRMPEVTMRAIHVSVLSEYEPHPTDKNFSRLLEQRTAKGLSNEEAHYTIPYMLKRQTADACRGIIKIIKDGGY